MHSVDILGAVIALVPVFERPITAHTYVKIKLAFDKLYTMFLLV